MQLYSVHPTFLKKSIIFLVLHFQRHITFFSFIKVIPGVFFSAAVMVHKEGNPYAPCINLEIVSVNCIPKPLNVLNGFQHPAYIIVCFV